MIYNSVDQLRKGIEGILAVAGGKVNILDEKRLRGELIDPLVQTAVFSQEEGVRKAARWIIRQAA
ncbi:MAG: aldolase, partial [Deltaproteobacteria bacterium]|nr:aldolase [Deltaproteobacteria bacterium]